MLSRNQSLVMFLPSPQIKLFILNKGSKPNTNTYCYKRTHIRVELEARYKPGTFREKCYYFKQIYINQFN